MNKLDCSKGTGLCKLKKKISESSLKSYLSKLNIIKKGIDYKKDDYLFINNYEEVINFLEKKYTNTATLKSFYIALFSVSKNTPKTSEEVKTAYNKKMLYYRDINNNQIKENKPSSKEIENNIDFETIQKKSRELEEEIKKYPKTLTEIKNKRTQTKFLNIYSDFITLYYFSHTPPTRLENHSVYFTEEKQKDPENNNIYVDGHNSIYYINNFKNVKKIGKIKVSFLPEMSRVLNEYYSFLKLNELSVKGVYYLFNRFHNGKVSYFDKSNTFGQYLTRTFKKYFDKKLTINNLRHYYTNEIMNTEGYSQMSINEKEKLHMKLLHSKSTGEEYYKIFEMTSDNEFKKDVDYEDKEQIEKILKKAGYKLKLKI